MGKLNTRQLEKWTCFLINRDGDICYYCKKPLSNYPTKAQVAHLDGNPENNPEDGSNYGLMHDICNRSQYKQRLEMTLSDRPMTPEMERRDILRPEFLKEVSHRINEKHSCCLGEAWYDVSRVIGSSVQFARDTVKQEVGSTGVWGIGKGKCKSALCKGKHIYYKDEIPNLEE